MGFKSEKKLTFSDLERSFKKKKNRSLETLIDVEKTISWNRIESVLLQDYPVGQKNKGNRKGIINELKTAVSLQAVHLSMEIKNDILIMLIDEARACDEEKGRLST